MNFCKTYSIMDEINYRLERLKKKELEGYNIALYGSGLNAERIIESLPYNVVGLMDAGHTGEFIYGKKVLSNDEILLLDVNMIILAAEPDSAIAIYDRIRNFCIINKIKVLDMYGNDMFDLQRSCLLQSINYSDLTYEILKNKGLEAKVIFLSLDDCLFDCIHDTDHIIDATVRKLIDNDIDIPEFVSRRKNAQDKLPKGMHKNLDDIYIVMNAQLSGYVDALEQAERIEKELWMESYKPNPRMFQLAKHWIDNNIAVIVSSHMICGESVCRKLLDDNSLVPKEYLCMDVTNYTNYIMRYLHAACETYGEKNVLSIGYDNIFISNTYGNESQIIKSPYQIYTEYFLSKNAQGIINKKDIILGAITSPFLNEIKEESVFSLLGNQEIDLKFKGSNFTLDIIKSEGIYDEICFRFCENPKVSIIIPAYNQFDYTYCCLSAIKKNTENIDYEIILVDDASDDETAAIEDFISGIHVIRNQENLLFVKNCNNAAKIARGEYLVYLNNDTQVQAGWLSALLDIAENRVDCGIVGSKLLYPDGSLQEAGGIIWNDGSGYNYGRGNDPWLPDYNYVRETDYISGASIMISRELWYEIGGFDERFAPAYYEDADLAFEVRKRGKKVYYQPKSVVIHFEGVSNGRETTTGIKRNQIVNKDKFVDKWKVKLSEEQKDHGEHLLAAADRKCHKKTVLFLSRIVPMYDKDAGSRSVYFYMNQFIKRGFLVKFVPDDFMGVEPYTSEMESRGIEVLSGDFYKDNFLTWIYKNYEDIDYVFANYPNCTIKYIDVLKKLNIPVRYYGHDLHYLRMKRGYELTGDSNKLRSSNEYFKKEQYLINKCDVVYYPSQVEIDIVKDKFNKKDAKVLTLNAYRDEDIVNTYHAADRKGVMFIGGFGHAPNIDAVKWFAKEIFPKTGEKIDMDFYIVGSDMPPEISNLRNEHIKPVGYVTDEELAELYGKIKMVVTPLRFGAGIKGKVIEAMFHGIPVLSTSIGMEGIPKVSITDMIADDADTFSEKLEKLYLHDELLDIVSSEETEIIRNNYSETVAWNNIAEDFPK